jgi:hypothetical protein
VLGTVNAIASAIVVYFMAISFTREIGDDRTLTTNFFFSAIEASKLRVRGVAGFISWPDTSQGRRFRRRCQTPRRTGTLGAVGFCGKMSVGSKAVTILRKLQDPSSGNHWSRAKSGELVGPTSDFPDLESPFGAHWGTLRIAERWPDHCCQRGPLAHEQQQMITSVKTGKKSERRWTPKQDQQLLDLVDAEATWPLIAITLGRGVEDVQDRNRSLRHEVELGLKVKKWKAFLGHQKKITDFESWQSQA